MHSPKNVSSFWLILTIALVSMVGPFTIDTYLPSFPSIESDFNISRAVLLQSIGTYLIASAISTLFWGPLADRIGRRTVILGTGFVYLLASVGCALSDNYATFLLFRILQGIAASGGMVASRAMLRDAYDQQGAHRAMSYVMMLFALAPAIAPIIGGWLHELFGWRSVFYFLALYAFCIILMSHRLVAETLAVSDRQSFHPVDVTLQYFRMLLHHRFQALVLALGSGFGGLFLYIAGSPTIIFDVLGLDNKHFAILFVPVTSGIILGSFISSRLSHRWTSRKIVNAALAVMSLASALNLIQAIWLDVSALTVVLPLILYGVGTSLAMPGFSVLALDCFPNNRGAASAVQSFVQTMVAALITSLVLPILTSSVNDFALAQLCCIGLALILWQIHNYKLIDSKNKE